MFTLSSVRLDVHTPLTRVCLKKRIHNTVSSLYLSLFFLKKSISQRGDNNFPPAEQCQVWRARAIYEVEDHLHALLFLSDLSRPIIPSIGS
jgi:hypothetical protein